MRVFSRRIVSGRIAVIIALTCVVLFFNIVPANASGVPFQTGDVLAGDGASTGRIKHFSANGTLLDTLDAAITSPIYGMAVDAFGYLYATAYFSIGAPLRVIKFDNRGNRIGTLGATATGPGESVVLDSSRNLYVGVASSSFGQLVKLTPAGGLIETYNPQLEQNGDGVNWIDFASDQCTVHYTSGGFSVKRFNVCTRTQLSDFTTGLAYRCYALRIRQNGENLVACVNVVYRLDSAGSVIQTYQIPGASSLFGLTLDLDGQTFWVGDYDSGIVARIDVASGTIVTQFNTGGQVGGVVVVGAITAAPSVPDLGPCEDCNAAVGHPINVTNGNTYIEVQDYSLPGVLGGISLQRTWNGLWPTVAPLKQAGMFGDSWRSTYEEQLQAVDSTHLKYWRGDGSTWSFAYVNSVWTLQSPVNQYVSLAFDSGTSLYTLTYRDGAQKVFNASGFLTAIKDRNGNSTTVTYDTANRITQITDAGGRYLNFTYGDSIKPEQVTNISDVVGTVATYSYDAALRLSRVVKPDTGILYDYTYDANGLITNGWGNRGSEFHTYDSARRGTLSQGADLVEQVTVSYGVGTAQITDSAGNNSTFGFTQIGGFGKVTSVSGTTCSSCGAQGPGSYIYDASGNRTQSTDALGRVTTFTYDAFGDVLTRSIVVGGNTLTWRYTYNNFGQVLTSIDPMGFVTTNTYDSHGNLLTITTPAPDNTQQASTTTFTYDSKGQLTQVTDPRGNPMQMTYTTAGLLATITDAQNKITRFDYDARGNRTSVTDPLNNTTTFAYDLRNRLTRVTNPDQTTIQYAYDIFGRQSTMTDPKGKITRYEYDNADRLWRVTDPMLRTMQYVFDNENNLTSITDQMNRQTRFQYDAHRRATQTTFSNGTFETYTYDAVGNLLTKRDANGNTITFSYDELNRTTRKQYPNSTAVNYTYDADSGLTQVQDATGTYQFAYDNMGRMTNATVTYSFIAGRTFSISYAYDKNSNRTSMTDPQNVATGYVYDTLNRLTSLTTPVTNFSWTYDAIGRRTQMNRSNGNVTTYQYDSLSRLLSVLHTRSGSTVDGATYTYDTAGNRISKLNSLDGSTTTFTNDDLYQLTQAVRNGSTSETYSYDGDGNRLSATGQSNFLYGALNELASYLTGSSGHSYVYDANGNPLTKTESAGTTSYTWDFDNRLTQEVIPAGRRTTTVTFKYDPFGRRIQKVSPNGTVNYIYDGANLLEELDASGNLVARYTNSLRTDEPLAATRSGTTKFYQSDGLGSVTSLAGTTGMVTDWYVYDSFGNITSSHGNFVQPFRFTGRELDSETGLMYYRARYFDPGVGRFLNADPIKLDGGVNLYAYTANDPVNLIDPAGLYAWWDDIAFTAGGMLVGVVGQGVGDLIAGRLSNPRDYIGAAVAGGVGGELLLYTGPVVAGAIAAGIGNATTQLLNIAAHQQCEFNWKNAGANTLFGGLLGGFGSLSYPGLTTGRNSYNAIFRQMVTKFQTAAKRPSLRPLTAVKMFLGRAADTGLVPGSLVGSAVGHVADAAGTFGGACTCQ